jgi:hypothetical protein
VKGDEETAAWRLAQANHLARLVGPEIGQDPAAAVLVMGDLNDLPLSPPVQALLAGAPLSDLLQELDPASRYTYVFGGYAELLDYILASPAAALVDAGILHMNTDFPVSWTADGALPFRASDHDVPWVTLQLPVAPETPALVECPTRRSARAAHAAPGSGNAPNLSNLSAPGRLLRYFSLTALCSPLLPAWPVVTGCGPGAAVTAATSGAARARCSAPR